MELYIVIGCPQSLRNTVHSLRGDERLTKEAIDAACVVLHGPCSWDEAQRFHDQHGAYAGRPSTPWAWTAVRGTRDPRWAKLLDQVKRVKRHPGRKNTATHCVIERQVERAARAVLAEVGAESRGGGWFQGRGIGFVQGLRAVYRRAERKGWVKLAQDGTDDLLVYTGRINHPED